MCLLLLAGAWCFWPSGSRRAGEKNSAAPQTVAPQNKAAVAPDAISAKAAAMAPQLFGAGKNATNAMVAVAKTNPFPYRLSNTAKPIGELLTDGRVILLANAFIDTGAKVNFSIPKHLTVAGEPGTYLVQSHRPMDAAYRALLATAGAEIVSYIPNNAYLVRMSALGAAEMAGKSATAAVLPYEPYYKISASLLGAAVAQKSLPGDATLTLGLFADNAAQTVAQIEKMGGTVLATDRSPFGPMVRVLPPADWTALAVLTGVQIMEPSRQRATANDLARVSLQIATDTVTNANYLGLSGSNVVVVVSDTGIDATHPDFTTGGNPKTPGGPPIRVTGNSLASLTDTNGHGTHVAGIIAGNGASSYSIKKAPQGSVTNADFRGKAPAAKLYSVTALNNQETKNVSDRYLQEIPALTNALISNNSWTYSGDNTYDLAAASYDAAVRDALPETMGSQPVLFVFAAGNDGGGNNDGGGGSPDTVLSPGTAKNVITVGALEQLRNITNEVVGLDGTTNAEWSTATDSRFQVAGYSARGNVGIGTEGTYGRFKPDVVAPGTFVVSTRSTQWDAAAYYNPTNYYFNNFTGQVVETNTLNYYNLSVPGNAVGVKITIVANANSPVPFPMLPIYVKHSGPPTPTSNDFVTTSNSVSIPPDGGPGYLATNQNSGFSYAVGNSTNFAVSYDLITEITLTNDLGNYYQVLSNLNNTLGPFYRYESGTSMAAPAVSGVLALMQDYFTNTLHATPSPALLKAMLINGARAVGNYNFLVTNAINFQGWGQPSVPNSVPSGITNQLNVPCASFFVDQSPTNALATGDQRTFLLTVTTNSAALTQPLRVTLAWTDPPGDPAAATKLVNNLDLMVSNTVTREVFWGNDIPRGSLYNSAWNTNGPPSLDAINNVENVFLSSASGGSYAITIIGRGVNVNAVTAQTNDVVQDYSLVISSGNGTVSNALTVTSVTLVTHPTDAQLVTFVGVINAPLLNQLVGASTPLLGTNTISTGTNAGYANNAVITLGMTNQWHFYVVTNATTFTNAAFITFLPTTLSVSRMGVYAATEANATRPEADLDLYVTTNPAITNLDPAAIAGADKSLSRGGTEFVAYSNATPGQVYYIGVQSEDQAAGEYGFLPVFSQQPFSQMNPDGSQTVNGLLLPMNIPDGSPAHPGVAYNFGLALQPMQVRDVIVTNQIAHQNYGDLIGVLSHGGANVVLNNHASLFNANGVYTNVYNDTGNGTFPGSKPTDGPGSLQNFQGQQGVGPWILTMVDDALTQTGAVTAFSLLIEPHINLGNQGTQISVQPGTFFTDYIDVPAGAIKLTVSATNLPPTANPPLQLYLKPFSPPTLADSSNMVLLTNCAIGTYPTGSLPGNSITTGPPLVPGRYFVGIYNNTLATHDVLIAATLTFSAAAKTTVDFNSVGNEAILDDAVSYSSLFVTNLDIIQSFQVGLRVDHPRISDLVFHLVSPNGTRYLLMENRGALSTNGAGMTIITTNITPVSSAGGPAAVTNFIPVGTTSGLVTINYNFFAVPDQMTVYYSTNLIPANLITNVFVNGAGQLALSFPPTGVPATATALTIVMNETNHPNQTLWTYTVGGVQTNYYYLAFTQDTNLTTTPIKFAPPPFAPSPVAGILWADSFETYPPGTYPPLSFGSGWSVATNVVEIVTNPPAFGIGTNSLQLDNGAVVTNLPTAIGQQYLLSFAFGSRASDDTNAPVATNANWQSTSVIFTARSTGTPLVLNASGNILPFANAETFNFDTNVLLDAFSLAAAPGNLNYQPEQDMADLTGTSAFGLWQLEIQDDRVGAGLTNTLVSWQLEMVFATTNYTLPPSVLPPGLPQTNTIPANSVTWFLVNVPTNADFATNILLFASAPVNLLFNQTTPATIGSSTLLLNQTSGISILSTNSAPTNIVSGSAYYLGVQNTNSFAVTNTIQVDFHLLLATNAPPLTNTVFIRSIIYTNIAGMNGYLLTWFAPSNDLFQVQWTMSLAPTSWQTFTNPPVISYNTNFIASPTNAQFNFFDDGSQTSGFGAMRYYRLILLAVPANTLTLPSQSNFTVNVSTPVTVTNTAIDSNTNAILTYSLVASPPNASISSNGIVTWTNAVPAGLAARFTTLVTDNGVPSAQAINTFTIFVAPLPSITNVTVTATNVVLQWSAPTSDQFRLRSATNLVPPIIWTPFPNLIVSTNGTFTFLDTNAPTLIKFYELILLP